MGVINLIVCAHDARDAAHRLTVPVSGGRRRARIRSGGARDEQRSQRRRTGRDRAAESGDGPGIVPAGIQARSLRSPRISWGPGGASAGAWG
jgi:hypothetical protein